MSFPVNWIQIVSVLAIAIGLIFFYLSIKKGQAETKMKFLNQNKAADPEHEPTHKTWDKVSTFVNHSISSDPKEIKKKMLGAGIYSNTFAKYFVPAKYLIIISGFTLIGLATFEFEWSMTTTVLFVALWLVVGIIFPDAYLASKTKSYRRGISDRLPYALDLMGVCVQTGMTIEASIRYLSIEMEAFDKDMSYLLRKLNDRSNLVGIESALEEFYQQVPTNEVRSFVMTLTQSLQYGSSIYSVLTTLSADIREVQILTVEEKVGKLAAKMSVPLILFIMIPIVILIAAPGVMRMLFHA